MTDLNLLKSQINEEIKNMLNKNEGRYNISIRALESIYKKLEKIEAIMKIQKYDIVFIGKFGSGKTTAICNLLKLISEPNINHSTLKDIPLLDVGPGFTTLGSVVINNSNKTYVKIEAKNEEEVKKDIDDICELLWNKNKKVSNDNKEEADSSPELIKFLRNAMSFKSQKDLQIYVENYSKSKEAFKKEVLEKINIESRTETEIYAPENLSIEEEKEWLRKTTLEINEGKNVKVSIPKVTYIFLREELFDKKKILGEKIDKIIDTKGIQGPDNDIVDDYISKKDNVICLFTDRMESPSQEILPYITRNLKDDENFIKSKVGLIVLPWSGQLEDLGEKESIEEDDDYYELGINKRKDDIENVLMQQGIDFDFNNIIFYNAYRGYIENSCYEKGRQVKKISSVSTDIIEEDRKIVLSAINSIISRRERLLLQEVQILQDKFNTIKKGHPLDEVEQKIVTEIKSGLETILNNNEQTFNDISLKFIESLYRYIDGLNAGFLRGMNNRFGIYEARDINIYERSKNILKDDIFYITTKPLKDKLINLINEKVNDSKKLKIYMETFEYQINSDYVDAIEEIQKSIKSHMQMKTFYPLDKSNEFWSTIIERWGNGPGYKVDVLSEYESILKETDIKEHLVVQIQNNWNTFKNQVLQLFA